MSSWYTRRELGMSLHPRLNYSHGSSGQRYAFFYCGSAAANMFNSLISAAILSNMDGMRGLDGWVSLLQATYEVVLICLVIALALHYPR